jgi:hypothetical protein
MGNVKSGGVEGIPTDSGEQNLRGAGLGGPEQRKSVDHTASAKSLNTDSTVRLDGEEDTLYDDGLDLGDDSGPLTGKDGKDDSQG